MALHRTVIETLMSFESKLSVEEIRSDMLRLRAELNAKIDRRCAELARMMERKYAEERSKAEIARWTLLIMLGNIALTVAVRAVLNAFGQSG
jgi:hypothetical protein